MLLRKVQLVIALVMLSAASSFAQTKEYIQAFIDKDCYLTGEQILVHVSVTDEKLQPMGMSKVAYVEVCDTKQMHAGGLVHLTNGEGWAAIDLPGSMHSGNYQMNVYTRYQRNFGKDCYYKRIVSIVNLLNPSIDDDIDFIELKADENGSVNGNISLTDKKEYSVREKVSVEIPQIEGSSFTVSVTRKDMITSLKSTNSTEPVFKPYSGLRYVPEVEGHIVTAKVTDNNKVYNSRLALVGKDASIFDGQIQKNGKMRYYTSNLYGALTVCVNGYTFDDNPVKMEFEAPYEIVLPDSLPALNVYYKEKDLKDRSISAQIEKSKRDITLGTIISHETKVLGMSPDYFYDLDEYTKFRTIREILIEFVAGIRARNVNKHKQLFTFDQDTHNYSRWAALVLLDGMPVYDIDALMEYDARRIKYVQIYRGRFQFGNDPCQGVISFISRKGSLQDFQVDPGTQMYTYDFPQNRPVFLSPIYDDNTTRQPDFRHTLYFNPQVSGNCDFYTSDLPGTYEISLQYLDKDRKEHKICSEFIVK